MKGTDVSIVRGVVSVEIGRWRRKELVRGLRIFVERDEEEESFDRAISSLIFSCKWGGVLSRWRWRG